MGGIGSGRRAQHKARVEDAFCLDLGHPMLRQALGQPHSAQGSVEWTRGTLGGSVLLFGLYLGPDRGGQRQLIVRFDPDDVTQPRQALDLELIRHGFYSRWEARCQCGNRARKLYVGEGPQLRCLRCAGLQDTSAALHDARLDELRGDLQGLEAAAGNSRRPVLAWRAAQLGIDTVERARRDLESRSPERRRRAVAILHPELASRHDIATRSSK